MPSDPLSPEHISFLSEFLNPVYLQPRTMSALASRFVEESSLELHSFLSAPLAEKLSAGLAANDARDGLGPQRPRRIPPHTAGTADGGAPAVITPVSRLTRFGGAVLPLKNSLAESAGSEDGAGG